MKRSPERVLRLKVRAMRTHARLRARHPQPCAVCGLDLGGLGPTVRGMHQLGHDVNDEKPAVAPDFVPEGWS